MKDDSSDRLLNYMCEHPGPLYLQSFLAHAALDRGWLRASIAQDLGTTMCR
jgi:hypothetical protein